MAFLNDTPLGIDLSPIFRMHLGMATAPVMTFDRLDVFTATYGGYIIYLTASHMPQSFLDLTEAIRKDLKEAGCVIQSDFRLHVTLGRVNGSGVKLREVIDRVPIQPFTLKLTDVDFRVFRGKTLYETKLSQ